jgi:hypothetical protein
MDGKICSIPDCGKPHDARGWCKTHYRRWLRHGDPLGGGPTRGYVQGYFRDVVLPYAGDDCLIWPYKREKKGYAAFGAPLEAYGVRTAYVSRLLCAEVNGPPPTSEHEAAHTCGAGNRGCVTRSHLVWKTPVQNAADKIAHETDGRGEKNSTAKLTADQIREIRGIAGIIPQTAIASRYGVSRSTVSDIVRGATWGHLPSPNLVGGR